MKTLRSTLRLWCIAPCAAFLLAPLPVSAQVLGTAGSYGALGSTTVTNTGNTVITGDLGVSPGLAITGFSAIDGGPGLFSGAVNQGNAAAAQARADLSTAYTTLAGLAFTSDLSGQDLGGLTLTPGVYRFSSSAQLTGTLTLDAQGNNDARFVFQIGSTLTTASNSAVSFINLSLSDECGPNNGLFWQVGSSATLGTDSRFAGNILALTSITLNTGASIDFGRALARNGAVTLDNNRIDASDADGGFCLDGGPGGPGGTTAVPEAGTYGLIGSGVLLFAVMWRRRISAL
ncbi:MAG TPA: ice-binding family protein [Opitutaceae bacterium]|nr:ice-binding family protein [Opitutaceae bacterium]